MAMVRLTKCEAGLVSCSAGVNPADRVDLVPSWLDLPILNEAGLPIPSREQGIAVAALKGLLKLPYFDASVSLRLMNHYGHAHLGIPSRVCGEITMMDEPFNVLVAFVPDYKSGFYTLEQWLDKPGEQKKWTAEDYEKWSDPEQWLRFYKVCLKRQVKNLQLDAKAHRTKAVRLEDQADIIRDLLL